jgi:hypothetical protein
MAIASMGCGMVGSSVEKEGDLGPVLLLSLMRIPLNFQALAFASLTPF